VLKCACVQAVRWGAATGAVTGSGEEVRRPGLELERGDKAIDSRARNSAGEKKKPGDVASSSSSSSSSSSFASRAPPMHVRACVCASPGGGRGADRPAGQ
jgi:hypothetical protein